MKPRRAAKRQEPNEHAIGNNRGSKVSRENEDSRHLTQREAGWIMEQVQSQRKRSVGTGRSAAHRKAGGQDSVTPQPAPEKRPETPDVVMPGTAQVAPDEKGQDPQPEKPQGGNPQQVRMSGSFWKFGQ